MAPAATAPAMNNADIPGVMPLPLGQEWLHTRLVGVTTDDEDEEEEERRVDDAFRELIDDDDEEMAVAVLAAGGYLGVEESDWYNHPNKPTTFEAACDVVGDFHLEHFTRYERDEIRTLAAELNVPHRIYVRGWVVRVIFGYHHKRIGRWTNYIIQWMFDEWGHLLQLNLDRFSREARTYAEALGRRLGYADPTLCRNILQVDGCFL